MLERVEEIPWHELRDAFGPASSTAARLVQLTDPGEQVHARALAELWLTLCHERVCLAQASAYAVPFLFELASELGVPARAAILELLCGMAEVAFRGCGQGAPRTEQLGVFALRAAQSRAVRSAAATRRALLAEEATAHALIWDVESNVRARAALLSAELACCDGERSAALARVLERAMVSELHSKARAAFVRALVRLCVHDTLHAG